MEEKLIEWEQKLDDDKIVMTNNKTFFTKLYQQHQLFSKATEGQIRLHESANAIFEKKAREEEENEMAKMFVAMEERHAEQLEQMKNVNKRAVTMSQAFMNQMTEVMMEITQNKVTTFKSSVEENVV